jgi:hypothetical protein
MKKGTARTAVLLVTLLATLLGACTPEATAPQGGAAITRVVPVAVPDVWCPAASGAGQDTIATKDKNHPRTACEAPRQSAPDTTK